MDRMLIEVSGKKIDTFLSYTMQTDVLTPADSFGMQVALQGSLDVRRELKDIFAKGAPLKAFVLMNAGTRNERKILQHTGILETRNTNGDRRSSQIQIHCRDLAAHLVDSNVPIKESVERSFVDLVRAYVEPWDIPVVLDPVASRHIVTGQGITTQQGRLDRRRARAAGVPARQYSRQLQEQADRSRVPIDELAGGNSAVQARARARAQDDFANGLTQGDIQRIKLAEARPQPGETVWGFIERHAKRFGLMMWFSPEGELIISSPDYGSPPLHRLVRRLSDNPSDPNNILSGGEQVNVADLYSIVEVFGRGPGKNAARTRIKGYAVDPQLPYDKRLVVHDQSIRTREEAERRARRELALSAVKGEVLQYEVAGHSDGQHVYGADTIVEVYDEVAVVAGRWYCLSREFSGDRGKGSTTKLTLIPPGSLVL